VLQNLTVLQNITEAENVTSVAKRYRCCKNLIDDARTYWCRKNLTGAAKRNNWCGKLQAPQSHGGHCPI
jgi:hypothetical protein